MKRAAELGGFFSAHAVWSVCDGETLVPIYAYHHPKGGRAMERLLLEQLEDSVEMGRQQLGDNPHKAERAVLIFDGRIPINGRKFDSLIVEFREYSSTGGAILLAIPYSPPNKRSSFAVHRPKILEVPEEVRSRVPEIFGAFYRGVEQHEEGAKVWEQHLDEST